MVVLHIRAAVDPEERRVFFPGLVIRRLDHQPADFRAVLAFEPQVLDGPELQPGEQRVIVGGQLSESPVFEGVDLRSRGVGRGRDDGPPAAAGDLADDLDPPAHPLDGSSAGRD